MLQKPGGKPGLGRVLLLIFYSPDTSRRQPLILVKIPSHYGRRAGMGPSEAMSHPGSSAVRQNHKKETTMKPLTFHTIAGLLAAGLVFGVNFAQAQAGTLDPKFGTDGTVTTIFGET